MHASFTPSSNLQATIPISEILALGQSSWKSSLYTKICPIESNPPMTFPSISQTFFPLKFRFSYAEARAPGRGLLAKQKQDKLCVFEPRSKMASERRNRLLFNYVE